MGQLMGREVKCGCLIPTQAKGAWLPILQDGWVAAVFWPLRELMIDILIDFLNHVS